MKQGVISFNPGKAGALVVILAVIVGSLYFGGKAFLPQYSQSFTSNYGINSDEAFNEQLREKCIREGILDQEYGDEGRIQCVGRYQDDNTLQSIKAMDGNKIDSYGEAITWLKDMAEMSEEVDYCPPGTALAEFELGACSPNYQEPPQEAKKQPIQRDEAQRMGIIDRIQLFWNDITPWDN